MEMLSAKTEQQAVAPSSPSFDQIARAFDPGANDIVFISGSRLERLGNERSDYDMYVIQPETARAHPFVTVVLDGNYIVYETFSQSHALRNADTLNGMNPSDFKQMWALSWFELDFYYRVLIGRGLVNEPAFVELQKRFRKDVIDARVHSWCGLRAVVYLEEAERKAAIGKDKGAYVSAQQAVAAAVDSFLAAHGESYPGFKWRFEKLRRCTGESDEIYKRAWRLKASGARPVAEYVADVKAFCDDLGMRAFEAWSLDDIIYKPAGTSRVVMMEGRAYLIENKNALYELTPDGQQVWSWIDGVTTRRELIGRAMRETAMSANEATAFFFTLAAHGLIT